MEVMKATTARDKTIKAIQAKRECLLKKIDARITATISKGQFKCNFMIDSPTLQDELFDSLTSLGYAVHFSSLPNSDSRIMIVSWEDTNNE